MDLKNFVEQTEKNHETLIRLLQPVNRVFSFLHLEFQKVGIVFYISLISLLSYSLTIIFNWGRSLRIWIISGEYFLFWQFSFVFVFFNWKIISEASYLL